MSRKRSRTSDSTPPSGHSRREREIMDALYRLGRATAAGIHAAIPDPPSTTAIRTHLAILERKGHIRHASDGTRYIYEPCIAREQIAGRAMASVLKTFFDNSVEHAVAAMLTRADADIPRADLDRLATLIEQARKEGR